MSQRDVLCGAWGKPNKGLELTASSGSSGPAFGVDRAQWFICVACLMLRRACRHNTLKRLVLAW